MSLLAPIYNHLVSNGQFKKSALDKCVMAVRNNVIYATSLNKKTLYKSSDSGATWSTALWTVPDLGIIRTMHTTASGAVLAFTEGGKLYRSSDDATFVEILTGISSPLVSTGVDSNGAVVCFGEYPTTAGGAAKIWVSTNDGATFTVSLDVGTYPTLHIHSCQYLPYQGCWLATTGDGSVRWITSVTGLSGSWKQTTGLDDRWKTLAVISQKRDEIMFASDGGAGSCGFFKVRLFNNGSIDYSSLIECTRIPSSYGIAGSNFIAVFGTMAASSLAGKQSVYIMSSIDGGQTFQIEGRYKNTTATYGGFTLGVLGPDKEGKYYLPIVGSADYADNTTIVLSPDMERPKKAIKGLAQVSIANKDVVELKPWPTGLVVRDTDSKYSPMLNVGQFKKIYFSAYNDSDQAYTLKIRNVQSSGPVFAAWDGSSYLPDITIPAGTNCQILLNTKYPWLNDFACNWLELVVKAATAPTTGTVTISIWGVPN